MAECTAETTTEDEYTEHQSLMLVGRAGRGRTSVARTLLNCSEFPGNTNCSIAHGEIQHKGDDTWKLTVIDTPGTGDLNFTKERIIDAVTRQKDDIQQVDAFLYVMKYGSRVSSSEIETIDLLEDRFYGTFLNRAIFVFAHRGRRPLDKIEKQKYVDALPLSLKTKIQLANERVLIVECGQPEATPGVLEFLRGMVRDIMLKASKPCILKEEASLALWDIAQYVSVLEYFTSGQSGTEGHDFDDFLVVDFQDCEDAWVKVVVNYKK